MIVSEVIEYLLHFDGSAEVGFVDIDRNINKITVFDKKSWTTDGYDKRVNPVLFVSTGVIGGADD